MKKYLIYIESGNDFLNKINKICNLRQTLIHNLELQTINSDELKTLLSFIPLKYANIIFAKIRSDIVPELPGTYTKKQIEERINKKESEDYISALKKADNIITMESVSEISRQQSEFFKHINKNSDERLKKEYKDICDDWRKISASGIGNTFGFVKLIKFIGQDNLEIVKTICNNALNTYQYTNTIKTNLSLEELEKILDLILNINAILFQFVAFYAEPLRKDEKDKTKLYKISDKFEATKMVRNNVCHSRLFFNSSNIIKEQIATDIFTRFKTTINIVLNFLSSDYTQLKFPDDEIKKTFESNGKIYKQKLSDSEKIYPNSIYMQSLFKREIKQLLTNNRNLVLQLYKKKHKKTNR
jgi:hypothetical protein